MLAGLYGYAYYGDIEDSSGDEFAEHVMRVLYGVCVWLGSLKRDGDFYEIISCLVPVCSASVSR
jgi:hypothetical protein